MEAKEVLSQAYAALIQCDFKRAMGYYEQLLASIKDEIIQRNHHQSVNKRRRKTSCTASDRFKRDLLVGYANAMACCEDVDDMSVASAFQVYRQLLLNETDVDGRIMERLLRNATSALVERVRGQRRRERRKGGASSLQPFCPTISGVKRLVLNRQVGDNELNGATAGHNDLAKWAPAETVKQQLKQMDPSAFDVDPLLCSVCDDLLKQPVTVQCGHTFCRNCAMSLRNCSRCPVDQAPLVVIPAVQDGSDATDEVYAVHMEKDVLISRLVEKWWGAELKAEPRNENARHYLEAGQLDQALRSANESLEQGEWGWELDDGMTRGSV